MSSRFIFFIYISHFYSQQQFPKLWRILTFSFGDGVAESVSQPCCEIFSKNFTPEQHNWAHNNKKLYNKGKSVYLDRESVVQEAHRTDPYALFANWAHLKVRRMKRDFSVELDCKMFYQTETKKIVKSEQWKISCLCA